MRATTIVLVGLVGLAACTIKVDYKGTDYQCGPGGTCPPNFICESKLCVPVDPTPPACSKHVSAGSYHACAIRNDATVWCWGANDTGQLGNGTSTDSTVPVQVTGVKNAVAVAAGGESTCALDKSGAVWCWGSNTSGQLGDGTNTDTRTPVQAKNISGATALASGQEHACVLLADGSVQCWGSNDHGQLCDGTTTGRSTAQPVTMLVNPTTALGLGDDTTCAVDNAGAVRCCGDNNSGQQGNGMVGTMGSADQHKPGLVMNLPPVMDIAGGGGFACASDVNGATYCWGANDQGQLGIGSIGGPQATPVHISTSVGLFGLTAGSLHACGRDYLKQLWCWGFDGDSRLGDGTTTQYRPVPTIALMNGVVEAAAGGEAVCAVDNKGAIRCAGYDRRGQLGDGRRTTQGTPQKVPGITNATALAASGGATCAVLGDGTADCWGNNDHGQLGDGTDVLHPSPSPVVELSGITALAAGGDQTCAIANQGVYCWGANDSGQLGNHSTLPAPVAQPEADLFGAPTGLGLGDSSSCAIIGGQARCWGNQWGGPSANPQLAGGFSDVLQVAAGGGHTCVLRSGGVMECMGSNSNGQLGNGSCCSSTSTWASPTNLSSGVMAIGARGDTTFALLSDGTVRGMGYGDSGQIGNGQTQYENAVPQQASGLTGAVQIAIGFGTNCARRNDGTVWCWGANGRGTVGDGTYLDKTTPVPVPGLSNVMDLASGGGHACALEADGTVWCWGADDVGQLGDGVFAQTHPVGVEMSCP